jgi:DsbC/DsbD-like thiol-disulfide interchange protein
MKSLCLAALAALLVSPLAAQDATAPGAWAETLGARVRLVAGDPASTSVWRAGFEVELQDGWKTYWRVPGDSGVPPLFDWSRSTNLAKVSVLWPAPITFPDGAGVSIGYEHHVVLPIHLHPVDPAKPVELVAKIDFAVCEKICVPAQALLSLTLDGANAPAAHGELVAAHENRVPHAARIGDAGPVRIESSAIDASTTPARLVVSAVAGEEAELFVEGPPSWFFPPTRAARDAAGRIVFEVPLDGLPRDANLTGTPLTLTVASPTGAIEVPFTP